MATSTDLIRALKRSLKSAGITYARVAEHLGLSEASVKRMLAREDLSLSRLDAVCELAGLEISDLAQLAEGPVEPLTELTPEQEQALLDDPKLLLATYLALNQWRVEDMTRTFQIEPLEAVQLLAKLDRLGLIDLLPGNRIKLRTARNFRWRKDGPIQRLFEEQVRDEFLDAHFGDRFEALHFVGGLLSEQSMQQFERSLKKLAQEFDDLARADAGLPLARRFSYAAVLAARPWEFSLFAKLKRKPV